MNCHQIAQRMEHDKSISFWVRDAIADLHRRDPIDALADVEMLATIQRQRCEELGLLPKEKSAK
jgi:hypothetical protein